MTPRYVEADPFEGGKQAVAECWRNLTAVGAKPLAVTDNLNFGNPERPEIMGQLVRAIAGIGEACRALAFPVVSGNVSLYNETNGDGDPADPGDRRRRPDRGSGAQSATLAFKAEGEAILLIGAPPAWGTHLGQSLYLREILGREEGPPPPVDLVQEKRHGDFVRAPDRDGVVTRGPRHLRRRAVAVALAEMALASGIGAGSTCRRTVGQAQSLRRGPGPLCRHRPAKRAGAPLGALARRRPVPALDRQHRRDGR